MHKTFISLIVLFLVVSCSPEVGVEGGPCNEDGTCNWEVLVCSPERRCVFCGDSGEPCCEGDTCLDCCACAPDGICRVCGRVDGPCCEGGICDEMSVCGSDDYCHSCGLDGEVCCQGETCRIDWAFCGADGLCHQCGYADEPCCEGDLCSDGYLCGVDGLCQACGGRNQSCCEGRVCGEGKICTTEDLCVECGSYDEPCCTGDVCDEGYVCEPDGTCSSCGSYIPCEGNTCNEGYYYDEADDKCYPYGRPNYRCREGNQCDGWFECQEGLCVNPFKIDNTRSETLCEAAEIGTSTTERDWCYWYAAYLKDDLAICEHIFWDEMLEKCQEGKNPDNYYVLPW
jgi:hypothetical protein